MSAWEDEGPSGYPQPGSDRPSGHPYMVSSHWVCCPLGVGGQVRELQPLWLLGVRP